MIGLTKSLNGNKVLYDEPSATNARYSSNLCQSFAVGIEATFKSMYDDYCQGNLPVEKIRHSVYMNYSVSSNRSDSSATSEPPQLIDVASCPTGPITDLLGVRKYELIIAISPTTYRKSFRDVCKEFSIINKFKADE